jgi:hypothetical protein
MASAVISAGVRGTFGLRSGVVMPLIAASMMTGSDAGWLTAAPSSGWFGA